MRLQTIRMKNIRKYLFKDPLAVKSASDSNETTFTDSTSALVIKQSENRFTYTNFADYNLNNATNSSPLFQSIDYINTHAGWGNPYILSNLFPEFCELLALCEQSACIRP